MAHSEASTQPDAALAHEGHDAQGHDHAAMLAEQGDAGAGHPCLYCPPGGSDSDSCDGHGGCAYPHDPQVDARGAAAIFAAVPVSFFAPIPGAERIVQRAESSAAGAVPRVRISVSYCRFLE